MISAKTDRNSPEEADPERPALGLVRGGLVLRYSGHVGAAALADVGGVDLAASTHSGCGHIRARVGYVCALVYVGSIGVISVLLDFRPVGIARTRLVYLDFVASTEGYAVPILRYD